MNNNFEKKRLIINKIDQEIFSLLEKRLELVKEIGKIKKEEGLKIVDKKREIKIIENRKKETSLRGKFIEKIYRVIFDESYTNQK